MDATIALAGNPNSGKTTLFNDLTGARQHVGNYPGVTVEKKEGYYNHNGNRLHVVDLPGTYSLTGSGHGGDDRDIEQFGKLFCVNVDSPGPGHINHVQR